MTATAVEAGVHRLALPTGFAVGDVNVYLLDGDPLTLVDCGPAYAATLVALEDRIAAAGRRLEDVELVVVTHQHVDHAGLAATIAARSGAQVAALDLLAPLLETWPAGAEEEDEWHARTLVRHGVDEGVVEVLRATSPYVRNLALRTDVGRRLRDGETIDAGSRALRVVHRPGHSPSDTLLVDERDGVAFGGDHLLGRVSSNALLARPLDPMWDGRTRPRSLLAYRRSLQATRDEAPRLVLGGHGDPVADVRALVERRLAGHEQRAARLLDLLADGPRTAHELARRLFGGRATTQALLTISEVVGHLDLLVDRGLVAEDGDGSITRFRRTEP